MPPKSMQAAKLIKNEISRLGLKPGSRILTVRQFAERLSVSKQVVQSAFALLEKEGLLETRSRHGTFIAAPKSQAIGLLLHSKSDAYAMMLVKSINERTTLLGVNLRTRCFKAFASDASREASKLVEDGSKALLIPWMPQEERPFAKDFAEKCPVPVAFLSMIEGFERYCAEDKSLYGSGNVHMTLAACRYFRLLGAERIALLGPAGEFMRHYLEGYSSFISESGLPPLVKLFNGRDSEMSAIAKEWKRFKGSLAVVCYDDIYAMRLISAFRAAGLTAPSDFRVIGRNDIPQAAAFDPPLTTFKVNYANLAEIAVNCALAAARGKEWHSTVPAIDTMLVRRSCGGAGRLTPGLLSCLADSRLKVEEALDFNNNEERQ